MKNEIVGGIFLSRFVWTLERLQEGVGGYYTEVGVPCIVIIIYKTLKLYHKTSTCEFEAFYFYGLLTIKFLYLIELHIVNISVCPCKRVR